MLLEGTEDVAKITDKRKQVEMIIAIVLMSETMVNKTTEDEPAFKFFTKHFADLRNLMHRLLAAVKVPGPGQFFVVELLEPMMYLMLDFTINETASAAEGEYSFPVSKADAKLMLSFANEAMAFLLKFVEEKKYESMTGNERNMLEKLLPAACKLVTYMGGYLQQDKSSPEGTAELKTGLKHI